ncbi:MAG TPA: DUF456 domain-containing protein [Phycisphaerae bacterium]|nr:DUF456 domain-containing protein [Phycisphaerae bacterium]HPS53857.1 DUF456 domain-containing protein [Phycisphaerae bacterium]
MDILIACGLLIVNVICLAITAMTFPGNWMMVTIACLVAWWRWDEHFFGIPVLVLIVLLAALGEVLEFATSAVHVKKAGGSKSGSWGSLIGAVIGLTAGTFLIPVPVLGTLIGACGGAFLGAMLCEKHIAGKDIRSATGSGWAAAKGRFMGTVYKFICGVIIYFVIGVAAFA